MKYEMEPLPESQYSFSFLANETEKEVVHLIQLVISRFVNEEFVHDTGGHRTLENDQLRCELIDKEIAGTITVAERSQLTILQQLSEGHFDKYLYIQ